ncbi:hypothetical protein [Parathalassolituus penaei]|uniref:Tyr recombinase domain-containing protein n=1 Tax=Parathalassolituus penaei TaxID=2997323 RepID=A0A9X3EQQ8_9GAMM|nr:hypothetical protein [Parathalassolituus penaei]MCY0967153.1 hypothetical protein [Parathalassolituus penaei]
MVQQGSAKAGDARHIKRASRLPISVYLTPFFDWSKGHNLDHIWEAIYLALGLNHTNQSPASPSTLATEFNKPESLSALHNWSSHPTASQLLRFSEAFKADPRISRSFTPVGHSGSASNTRKQFNNFTESTYLLTMLVNPLSAADNPEKLQHRRMLRLWLCVQSIERVIYHRYLGDQRLSAVCRFLILGPEDFERWKFVDAFLERADQFLNDRERSFENHSLALSKTAEMLLLGSGKQLDRSCSGFLNNIISIAAGECHPYPDTQSTGFTIPRFNELSTPVPVSFLIGEDEDELQFISTLTADPFGHSLGTDEQDDESEALQLTSVDPGQTEAQQLVASRSILLQSAEATHHLPWSWDQVLPVELELLNNWIETNLRSTDRLNALGSAFCWLAMNTGRSLAFATRFPIDDRSQAEWTANESLIQISKLATRRQNAWRPKAESLSSVHPFADELSFTIPERVSYALKTASQLLSFQPKSLQDLWIAVSPNEQLDVWLNQNLPESLSRLSSGKLFHHLSQQVFNRTGDHNLARGIAAHPNAGLPAACGYGSWDIKTIETGLDVEVSGAVRELPKTTLLIGSLLNPQEELLRTEIAKVTAKLQEPESCAITHHNSFTQYVVNALYAATGSRFLKDPFERLTHFNLNRGFVFLNDKSDEGLHDGRVVPLTQTVTSMVCEYLEHLKAFSSLISNTNPELSRHIDVLIQSKPAQIPLFFQLDNSLNWHSMSETNLPGSALFDWPLPRNLFRHRFSQQLRRQGVHPEVIDGWMGHAERQAASYGDDSPRCWQTDAEQYRQELESVFLSLGFELIKSQISSLAQPEIPLSADSPPNQTRLFGEQLRQQQRSRALKKAIRFAQQDIADFLGSRSFSDLDEASFNRLINRMLLRDGGIGHHFAAVRFNVLKKQLLREAPEQQHRIRKRPAAAEHERVVLNQSVAPAASLMPELKQWAKQVSTTRSCGSKVEAVVIGTLLLCIEKRISYQRMLLDVLTGQNFRLIQHRRQSFIEYSEELETENPYCPIQRHEVSYQSASLLGYAMEAKKVLDLTQLPQTAELESLCKLIQVPTDIAPADLLSKIAQTVEQANLIDLPGMVSAALAGRVLSTSLPIQDHLRILEKRPRSYPSEAMRDDSPDQIQLIKLLSGRQSENDDTQLRKNTREFRRAILWELNHYEPSQARNVAKTVEVTCQAFEGKVSNTILLVGHWLVSVIRRGKGRGKKFTPLAESSVRTYFSSLMTPFEQLAFSTDLLSLDEESITDLYGQMLQFRLLKAQQVGYFSDRLVAFHRWASHTGISEPDWSELNLESDRRVVRPGILTEQDYLNALKRIRQSYPEHDQYLMLSFVLIMTYRFGLRLNEATALLAKDLCEYQGQKWLLVRNNRFRALKSKHSRRVVPLLFDLTMEENAVIEQLKTRLQTLSGTDKNQPLLAEIHNGKIVQSSLIDLISPALISVIREVTGNPNLVLHHCRHAFHNRTAAVLLGIRSPLTENLLGSTDQPLIREVVLGPQNEVSRRCPMALARLLGHRHPSTGMSSYNHLLLEWADQLTPVSSERTHKISNAFDAQNLEKYQPPKAPKQAQLVFLKPTLLNLMKTLRLVSLGRTFEQAGAANQLDPEFTRTVETVFYNANHKMRFKQRGVDSGMILGSEHPHALIEYISDDAWIRMMEAAANYESKLDTTSDASFPSIDVLPSLVGRKRQLLMEAPEHCQLVKRVIDIFEIDESHYKIAAANDNERATQLLVEQGFTVTKQAEASALDGPLTIDLFEEYDGIEKIGSRTQYGVLNLIRNDHGVIRNSNELAVVFLSSGIVNTSKLFR